MKLTSIIVLLCLFTASFAQTTESPEVLTNKKGTPILPAKGDWGIGISAQPFLEYAGNMLTQNFNPAPVFTSNNPGFIFGKYYTENNSALRLGLSLGVTGKTDKSTNAVDRDEYNKNITSALTIGISVGLEKYKSLKNRLRGYYGFDMGLYKLAYNDNPSFPGGSNVGKFKHVDALTEANNYKEVGGNTFSLNGQAVLGVEFFFAPKMSLSSELGLVGFGSLTTDRKYIPETGDEIITETNGSEFGIYVNTTSLINLFFYF